MYLIGDIGNTEVKICLFNRKKKLTKKITLKTNLITINYLKKKLNFLDKKKNFFEKALFCSVVPECYKKIKIFIKYRFKIKSIELKDLNLTGFIKIKVNNYQVGSDRISNAIGIADNKFNYIVVDFGTATTFDVIIKNNYLGGIIAPGIKLSLNTLIKQASLIPLVNLTSVRSVLGKNTISAVRSGFYWWYIGLIKNIIKKITNQTKKKYKIIFTGGLSNLFKKSIDSKVYIKKDLTIIGLLKVVCLVK